MTNQELVNKCLEIKDKYSTKYAKGTFGQCATPSFIYEKAKQYWKNMDPHAIFIGEIIEHYVRK